MTEIFVFGTLCHDPLRDIVAGTALTALPATMADATVRQAQGSGWPVLVSATGQTAAGVVLAVDDAALARLDAYEACFDYHRSLASVQLAGQSRQVWVYRTGPGVVAADDAWRLAEWAARWGKIECFAAAEVMRQLASAPPAEVGARYWIIASRAQAMVAAQSWRRPALVGANPARDAVQVIEQRYAYDKFFAVEEVALRHTRFDGQLSAPQERAVFRVSDAVTVLPYDPRRDRILVIEQLRLGAFVQQDPYPWLLEPIAGMIDAGETAPEAARREALEEAGLMLGELHLAARYYPSPGGVAQVLTSYIAIADLPDDITGIAGHAGEGEDILSHLVPWDLACTMLSGGDMANAPLVISMQWLMLNRMRLRASG